MAKGITGNIQALPPLAMINLNRISETIGDTFDFHSGGRCGVSGQVGTKRPLLWHLDTGAQQKAQEDGVGGGGCDRRGQHWRTLESPGALL